MNLLVTFLSITSLAVLSACGSQSEPAATAPPASRSPAKPAVAPDDPTAGMARAVGNGKPGAAVDIRYEFAARPAVGTPTELQVAFIPTAGVDSLNATISGMEGITVAGTLTADFANVEPGKAYTHTVSVLPDRPGVFYISVAVNTQIGGSSLARTFSIPLAVGSPPAQEKPQPQRDASGEAIQPMKAEESKR